MFNFIINLFIGAKAKIAGLVLGAIGLFSAYFVARNQGKKSEQNKTIKKRLLKTREDVRKYEEARTEIDDRSSHRANIVNELRESKSDWDD